MTGNLVILKRILLDEYRLGRVFLRISPLLAIFIGVQLFEPYVYKLVVDSLSSMLAAHSVDAASLWRLLGIWFAVILVTLVVKWTYGYYGNQATYGPWKNAYLSIVDSLLRMPHQYQISTSVSEKTSILKSGEDASFRVAQICIDNLFLNLPIFFGFFLVGLFVSPKMVLALAVVLPPFAAFSFAIGKKAHESQKRANDHWDRTIGRAGDALVNFTIVKLFDRYESERAILGQKADLAIAEQRRINILWEFLDAGSRFFSFFGSATVIAFGSYFILRGEMTVGGLLFFLVLISRIQTAAAALEVGYRSIVLELAKYRKAYDVLSGPKEADPGTRTLSDVAGRIVFESVSFRYPSTDREVLSEIFLEIPKGSRIALVGRTGSGKSTIANLLLRFYEPTKGRISVDGTDVRDFTLASYRSKFAAVFQDTTLFNDTLRANLGYVRDDVDFETVREACEKAEILDFIESLPDGFDTLVGER